MGPAPFAQFDLLRSRTQLTEAELQARWRESRLGWSEWIDWMLAEIDAVEASLLEADLGLFATKSEVEAAFQRYRLKS
jgi:predicted transcriptional regulator